MSMLPSIQMYGSCVRPCPSAVQSSSTHSQRACTLAVHPCSHAPTLHPTYPANTPCVFSADLAPSARPTDISPTHKQSTTPTVPYRTRSRAVQFQFRHSYQHPNRICWQPCPGIAWPGLVQCSAVQCSVFYLVRWMNGWCRCVECRGVHGKMS